MKTESVAEFLARGGQIKKCQAKAAKVRRTRRAIDQAKVEDLDYNLLPTNLKIRFGIRNGQEEK